jgi:GNAT superfamily N-acetyltransferase
VNAPAATTNGLRVTRERVTFRPETDGDAAFSSAVYASSRADELRVVPWTDEQKSAFLAGQFEAQRKAYRENFAAADFLLVLVDGAPAGRLYVHRTPIEINLVDVALLPPWRGAGIGTALVGELLDESRRTGVPVRLHVEHRNPARRLYERLGFAPIADLGVYVQMEWRGDRVS